MAYKRPIDLECPRCRAEAGASCHIPTDAFSVGPARELSFYHAERVDAAFDTFIPRCVGCGKVAHPGELCGGAP